MAVSLSLVLLGIVGAVLLLLLAVVIANQRAFRKYSHIPGPKPHWLLGNYREFAEALKMGTLHYVAEKYKQDGIPVIRMFMFWHPVVLCFDPVALKEVVVTKNEPKAAVYMVLGRGLLTFPDETLHGPRKKALLPFFRFTNLQRIAPVVIERTVLSLHRIANMGTEYFNIAPLFSSITLDVIGEAGFGVKFHSVDNPEGPLSQAVAEFLHYRFKQMQYSFYWLNIPARMRFNRTFKVLADVTTRILDSRQQQLESSNDDDVDLVDLMLKIKENGKPLPRKDVIDEFLVCSVNVLYCIVSYAINVFVLVSACDLRYSLSR